MHRPVGLDAHGLAQMGLFGDTLDVTGEVLGIEGAGDEAGGAVGDEILGPALIGDDAGDTAGQRLQDHVSEGVGGAGEQENIGAGK